MALLQDQVCIVTGAGQGLGRSIVLEMAKEGASVALLERNADTLEQTSAEIQSLVAFLTTPKVVGQPVKKTTPQPKIGSQAPGSQTPVPQAPTAQP